MASGSVAEGNDAEVVLVVVVPFASVIVVTSCCPAIS